MKNCNLLLLLLMIALLAACNSPLPKPTDHQENIKGYIPADQALFDTIYAQDSLLFMAFNHKDIDKLKSFFSPELEVFQDNTGLRRYDETIGAFTELFAKDYTLTRTLVKNSLEVYPIKGFGAIETGRHTFCHTENNKEECATFKFVHIWKNEKGHWSLCKIVTYDHKN